MLGYSRTRDQVFTLPKKLPQRVNPKIKVDTKLLKWVEVTTEQWRQIKRLQGRFTTLYLKWRYGSLDTYILLAFFDQILAYIEWIVPARKIKSRYCFVSEDSYSIISCLTEPRFRRLGIYTSQIQKVADSDIPAKTFWIWSASTNIPSLKGISNAGGVKVGEFVQKKWLWGMVCRIRYLPAKVIANDNREFG